MRCHIRLVLVVVLLLFYPHFAWTHPSRVSESVRTAILAQEPGWTLARSRVRAAQFMHVWVHWEERITISYQELVDVAAAIASLDECPVRVSLGGGEPLAMATPR